MNSFIFISLLLFTTITLSYSVHGNLGCSKLKPKTLGINSNPQYVIQQAPCLSSSKILLDNKLLSSQINSNGILENIYQLDWLIRLCNECPQYNIFNITAIDTTFIADSLTFSNIESLLITNISLLPTNQIAQSFNLLPLSIGSNCIQNNDTLSLECNLFGCPSYLSHYPINCSCINDRICADFNLSIVVAVTGNSSSQCPSFNSSISNCVSAKGVICSQYSNNFACINCTATNPFPPAKKNVKKNIITDLFKSISHSLIDSTVNDPQPNDFSSLSDFPDLFPVCAHSCSSEASVSFSSANLSETIPTNILCGLSNDQCANSGCASQSCESAVFNCVWGMKRSYSSNYPFSFSLSLPFTPIILPSECIIDPSNVSTVLCSITSNSESLLTIEGSFCIDKTQSYTDITLSANVTNIQTGSCNTVIVENSTTTLIVPSSNVTVLTKTAIDINTNLSIDAIDCSNPSSSSVLTYYRVTVSSPSCSPMSISFSDISEYPIDRTFGADGLVVSDPSVLSCTLINDNQFQCNADPNVLSPGQVITVDYRVTVSCSLCNTFDSAACLNNFASNNLTDITITGNTCPVNIPTQLDFVTPIACPCPVCDCVAEFANFTTVDFPTTNTTVLYASTGNNLRSNYLVCIVYSNSVSTANYTTPIWGWIQHISQSQWIAEPTPGATVDPQYYSHMTLGNQDYRMSCCGYQNTIISGTGEQNPPIVTGQLLQFKISDMGSSTMSRTINSTFTCTNEAYSTSSPSHYPIFRKVVG